MDHSRALFLTLSILLLGACLLHADDTIFPDAGHAPTEGYREVVWGTSLNTFRHDKYSNTANTDTLETAAITHLLLNFHETTLNSVYPLTNTEIDQVPGSKTDYVFYHGRFCMAVIPVAPKSVMNFEKFIAKRFTPKELTTYTPTTTNPDKIHIDYQRYDTQEFDDNYLVMKTGSRAYRITVHSIDPQKDLANYLVYVSEDYFTDPHNAWGDYLSQQKKNQATPEQEPKRSN